MFLHYLGIIEEEIVYIRYVNMGEPVTKMIGIEAPLSVDAPGILKAIQNALSSLQLLPHDLEDDNYLREVIYNKMISVNFDGASVMAGNLSGVQKRFKDLQPGLVYTHCVAHVLELAVLDSIKMDDP